ncbi:MAG: RnfH family protein [Methylococcales bacterium]|nr:RnfH family protein [Methylococcales bacterium]
MSEMITIEIAYATPDEQVIVALNLPENSTVKTALNDSGLLTRFPALELTAVGIFGKLCELNQLLKAGDRVEIYRALHNDPKEARRQRAGR